MGVLVGLQNSNSLHRKTLYPGNSAQMWVARNVAYQNHKKDRGESLVWANRNCQIGTLRTQNIEHPFARSLK
jgi:hypothetical protein